jgi:hypothetical protein
VGTVQAHTSHSRFPKRQTMVRLVARLSHFRECMCVCVGKCFIRDGSNLLTGEMRITTKTSHTQRAFE